MKTITVHRAGDIGTTVVVEPVTIIIGEPITTISDTHTLVQWENLRDEEGAAIAQVLIETLPQGVLQVVMCRLMEAGTSAYMGRLGT